MKRLWTPLKWLLVVLVSFIGGVVTLARMQQSRRYDPPTFAYEGNRPFPEGEAFVKEALTKLGLHTRIFVFHDPWGGCAAAEMKKPYILVGGGCDDLYRDGKLNWTTARILLHEVGHILNHHKGKGILQTPPEDQREADEFAGYALKRIGATREQALKGCFSEDQRSVVERGYDLD